MRPIRIPLSIWKEGDVYVSFTPALDLSSCGDTRDEAIRNMDEAARFFFQTAEERNCLQELLESYGWELCRTRTFGASEYTAPRRIEFES